MDSWCGCIASGSAIFLDVLMDPSIGLTLASEATFSNYLASLWNTIQNLLAKQVLQACNTCLTLNFEFSTK